MKLLFGKVCIGIGLLSFVGLFASFAWTAIITAQPHRGNADTPLILLFVSMLGTMLIPYGSAALWDSERRF